jgi:hypothetical protein
VRRYYSGQSSRRKSHLLTLTKVSDLRLAVFFQPTNDIGPVRWSKTD